VCGQGRGRAVDHRPVLHDVRLTRGRRCDRVASGSCGVDAQWPRRNERRTLGAVIGRRVIAAGAAGAAILLAASCAGPAARQPAAASATRAPAAQPAPGPSHRAAPRPGSAPARPLWPAFSATVSGPLTPGDVPFSWRPGCPAPPGQLRAIHPSCVGFDGRAHTGEIIVNASVVHQVIEVSQSFTGPGSRSAGWNRSMSSTAVIRGPWPPTTPPGSTAVTPSRWGRRNGRCTPTGWPST
jgi:hypothetical protein